MLATWLARACAWLISKPLWFIKFIGRENIPDKSFGAFIIASNHQTYADPAWICIPLNHPLRYMAFDEAFRWRIIGPLIRFLGAFPVSLEKGGTLKAMKEALFALRNGAALVIFPEGAREFADGKFLPFKTGVVRIAMQANVPILPVTIVGGNNIWPQKKKYPRVFRRVEIIYHPLIFVKEDKNLGKDQNLACWTEILERKIAISYRP